jgi:hypothetical protein
MSPYREPAPIHIDELPARLRARRGITLDRVVAFFALAYVVALAAHSLLGCGGPSAEAAYGAALLRCVDQATTLAESRECRRHVDGAYGITQTVAKDGGR